VTTDPIGGSTATFSIEGLATREENQDSSLLTPLYDDGTHGDQKARDGIYTGSYTVKAGDDVKGVLLLGKLTKANKKSATKSAVIKLTIDTVPPSAVTDVIAVDKPDDEGGYILLSWQSVSHARPFSPNLAKKASELPDDAKSENSADVASYNLYRSQTHISTLKGLSTLDILTGSQYMVEVPKNDVDYYFAVTAVDAAGNESELDLRKGGSVSEPVRAIDNTPPEPITGLFAKDTPDDSGKTVSLAWQPSPAPDFLKYDIYLSATFIETLKDIHPILTVADRNIVSIDVWVANDNVDYYFAVTAVDTSYNISSLSDSSVAGPIQSIDNMGEGEEASVRIISLPFGGQVRAKTITFHWAPSSEIPFSQGYFYQLNGGDYQFTKANHVTFYNLREGRHVFRVKSAVGSMLPATRSFFVLPAFTFESEPNDSPLQANPLTESAIMRGQTDADVDWYLIRI